jgi:UTP--glucose-1-phosphate uridylyltransferase
MSKDFHKVKKAILPVAGFGTRFLPATKAQPKEMLSVVDKPVIQYLVEEAVASGIEEIIFVTGRGKRAIEDHFDVSYELEDTLVEKNKHDLLEKVQKISGLAKFSYVRQPVPMGDGHAILCAKHLVNEGEAVAVLFGDDLVDSEVPAIRQLLDVYERYGDSVVALSQVAPEEVSKFGVVATTELGTRTHEITQFVEKPKVEDAPSNLVAVGKYIITWDMLETLESLKDGSLDGEVRLADAFVKHIANNKPLYGYEFEGERHDCGDKFGFVKATIALGLKHPEVSSKLKDYLKSIQ